MYILWANNAIQILGILLKLYIKKVKVKKVIKVY